MLKRSSIVVFVCLLLWFFFDFSTADKSFEAIYPSFVLNTFDAITSATAKVAIVPSNDPELSDPVSRASRSIAYEHIEEMVKRSIELAGGFDWLISPGDMVLIKPNIVEVEPPGSGVVSDIRVIKALVKIIDEIDPGNMEIVIGEGSPAPVPAEMPYVEGSLRGWKKLWDIAGYQDLLQDADLKDINFRLSNLNGSPKENPWQDLVEVTGDFQALPQNGKYFIHKDVLNADVYITVPVMKIHDMGLTCSLKNQIGLAACTKYGFWKTKGVPQNNHQTKLTHKIQAPKYWNAKEIVDLSQIAGIDFVVVDAIMCLEKQKYAIRSGKKITNQVRMNSIIAGADPVAVDHVCSRIMGLNPDDCEQITLAEKVGLGTNDPKAITVAGTPVGSIAKRFIKNPNKDAEFGQSNRTWLLKGPYSISDISDPIDHAFLENENSLFPKAGKDGWSESVYFTDDRIDLGDYFDDPSNVVGYAFAYFDAPKDQEAELWIGSDEALKIYINGKVVYNYSGVRSYGKREFVSEIVKTNIKAGENTLLVKSVQKYGYYQFALNICEPESNPDFDGNRIWPLKFKTGSSVSSTVWKKQNTHPSYFTLYHCYPNPFNATTTIRFDLHKSEYITIKIFNINGQEIAVLADGVYSAGVHKLPWHADGYPSGIYFVSMYAGGPLAAPNRQFVASKKVVLQK